MNALKITREFLSEPVDAWPQSATYQAALTSIHGIIDCAERGVKLSSDFLDATKCEHMIKMSFKLLKRIEDLDQIYVNARQRLINASVNVKPSKKCLEITK